MKVTIIIEDEKDCKVTTINPENLSPLEFLSTEFIESYLHKRNIEEGKIQPGEGRPYSEIVPDEIIPPPTERCEDNLIEETKKFMSEAEYISTENKSKKIRGKRGPYKKHISDPGRATIGSNVKYLTPSTVDAVLKGKELTLPLPGIQATKNKFIVAGAYIAGRLEEARRQYKSYFVLSADSKFNNDILTWESWIATEFAKNQEPDRKIDGD